MTVEELITELQTQPRDADILLVVTRDLYSSDARDVATTLIDGVQNEEEEILGGAEDGRRFVRLIAHREEVAVA